jgi:hypothetical protein
MKQLPDKRERRQAAEQSFRVLATKPKGYGRRRVVGDAGNRRDRACAEGDELRRDEGLQSAPHETDVHRVESKILSSLRTWRHDGALYVLQHEEAARQRRQHRRRHETRRREDIPQAGLFAIRRNP